MPMSPMSMPICGLAMTGISVVCVQPLDMESDATRLHNDASESYSVSTPQCAVAALSYDGRSSCGIRVQDFEEIFDVYDLFIIEDFVIDDDARLDQFQSEGFGGGDPFQTTDVSVRVFTNDGSGLPGADTYTGSLVLASVPGTGLFDGQRFIADMGARCLPAGSYYLVWAPRLDFDYGPVFCFAQSGAHDAGGGVANNAWWWNPGRAINGEAHIPITDCTSNNRIGVNFVLCGELNNCSCAFGVCPADLDADNDADADDFFFFLDLFAAGDRCADFTGNGIIDSNDFFAYLDLFAQGCP